MPPSDEGRPVFVVVLIYVSNYWLLNGSSTIKGDKLHSVLEMDFLVE